MAPARILPLAAAALLALLSGCASSAESWHSKDVSGSVERWLALREGCWLIERSYLETLGNLDLAPDDPRLRQEHDSLRAANEKCRLDLMAAEAEKHDAVLIWETSIVERQAEMKAIKDAEKEADKRDREHGRKPPKSLLDQ